jgi:hypothetical protein
MTAEDGPSQLYEETTVERGVLRHPVVGGVVRSQEEFDPLDFVERWAGTVLSALILLGGTAPSDLHTA